MLDSLMNNMITFNGSDADYFATINYPDNQSSLILNLHELDVKKPVYIKCRIRNFSDLEKMMCLIGALKRNDFYIKRIDYVYLFGMRSDRAFQQGEPSYFKDVVLPILKTFGEEQTYVLFPHNRTILGLMDAKCLSLTESLYNSATQYIWGDQSSSFLIESLSPHDIFANFQPDCFEKKRIDRDIQVSLKPSFLEEIKNCCRPIFIMDDLCDGGGTFIAEAKYLRENGVTAPLNLFVGHGLFTGSLEPLLEYFDQIICTNSYQHIHHPRVKQIKVI